MYYHASPFPNLKELNPHTSNHNKPLVYLSKKRENTLVYLSNAVEIFCIENGISHSDKIHKWASYGFNKNGTLILEEYYPNATKETYSGVSGYIYSVKPNKDIIPQDDIPFASVTNKPVKIESIEFIPDAFEELNRMAKRGLIILNRFENNSTEKLNWIKRVIREEYNKHRDKPEYSAFLKAKFDFL